MVIGEWPLLNKSGHSRTPFHPVISPEPHKNPSFRTQVPCLVLNREREQNCLEL